MYSYRCIRRVMFTVTFIIAKEMRHYLKLSFQMLSVRVSDLARKRASVLTPYPPGTPFLILTYRLCKSFLQFNIWYFAIFAGVWFLQQNFKIYTLLTFLYLSPSDGTLNGATCQGYVATPLARQRPYSGFRWREAHKGRQRNFNISKWKHITNRIALYGWNYADTVFWILMHQKGWNKNNGTHGKVFSQGSQREFLGHLSNSGDLLLWVGVRRALMSDWIEFYAVSARLVNY